MDCDWLGGRFPVLIQRGGEEEEFVTEETGADMVTVK